jgi:dipeptidyl aminopeptidase/acylaminoacyl peptidase
LSWLDGSVATDLSSDGSTLLFAEQGAGSGTSAYAVYVRKTDGAPPTRIGEGSVAALSPDGTWAAAVVLGGSPSIVLLPTSVGESRVLPRGTLVDYEAVTWFPDGRRLLVAAREADRRVRLWEQDVSGGVPKPVSAEGLRVAFSSQPISPDGRHAAALDEDDRVWLQGLNGGAPERLDALNPGDIPIRWDADGASLYVYRRGELPAVVHRYRLRDRLKQPVAALAPADRVGVSALVTVHTTPDARTFFYTYSQTLSDLFVVSNLR